MASKRELDASSFPGRLRRLSQRIIWRLGRLAIPIAPWLSARVKNAPRPLVRLGTEYGGWTIVQPPVEASQMYAVLCGAGEDISLDLALQAKFDLFCVIADPTPRAIAHWQQINDDKAQGIPTPINGNPKEVYNTASVNFSKIEYKCVAVWTEEAELKFWTPANPKHVSHSAVNIQKTDKFIVVQANTLDKISNQPSSMVEIVKLDIEGAGLIIVNWMIDNKYLPNQILVEIEECLYPSIRKFEEVKNSINRLEKHGYDLVHFDDIANCTFVKQASARYPKKENYAA